MMQRTNEQATRRRKKKKFVSELVTFSRFRENVETGRVRINDGREGERERGPRGETGEAGDSTYCVSDGFHKSL